MTSSVDQVVSMNPLDSTSPELSYTDFPCAKVVFKGGAVMVEKSKGV